MPLLSAVVLLGVAPASCVCSEVRANGARAVATAVCVASAALLGVARTEVISAKPCVCLKKSKKLTVFLTYTAPLPASDTSDKW